MLKMKSSQVSMKTKDIIFIKTLHETIPSASLFYAYKNLFYRHRSKKENIYTGLILRNIIFTLVSVNAYQLR